MAANKGFREIKNPRIKTCMVGVSLYVYEILKKFIYLVELSWGGGDIICTWAPHTHITVPGKLMTCFYQINYGDKNVSIRQFLRDFFREICRCVFYFFTKL